MKHKTLWFIAVFPPGDIAEKIRAIQHEIADRFGPRRILKIPVHLTLEPPFRYDEQYESEMSAGLEKFFSTHPGFSLELRNFGSFRDDVVFIEVAPSLPLLELHAELSAFLREKTSIVTGSPWHGGYTPHITVANRDVTPAAHERIWREFNTRKFFAEFPVSDVVLLRHDEVEKMWRVHRRFPLLKSP